MSIQTEIRIDGAVKKLQYNISKWEREKTRSKEELKHLYLLFATLCLRERGSNGLLYPIDIREDDGLALKMLKGTGLKREGKVPGFYSFS